MPKGSSTGYKQSRATRKTPINKAFRAVVNQHDIAKILHLAYEFERELGLRQIAALFPGRGIKPSQIWSVVRENSRTILQCVVLLGVTGLALSGHIGWEDAL